MARVYDAHGRAGCVELRKSHETGTLVGVYNNEQALLDDSEGALPWSTVCELHGTVIAHTSLRLARWHAPNPSGWCEDCEPREKS